MLLFFQWLLIVLQSALEVSGLTLQRYANSRPGAAVVLQIKRPYWALGVGLYLSSILVYFFALAICPLSWLGVVSCSANILLSAVGAQLVGEHISRLDVAVLCCTIVSAALASKFEPQEAPSTSFSVGEKMIALDPRTCFTVATMFLTLMGLLAVCKANPSRPKNVGAIATVFGYAMASSLAQMCTKLFTSFAPACGWMPAVDSDDYAPSCTTGSWSPLVFVVPSAMFGVTGIYLMLIGCDRYENKFWIPNALALDLVLTTSIGLLVFGETAGMNPSEVGGFCCAGILAVVALWLGILGQSTHDAMERRASRELPPVDFDHNADGPPKAGSRAPESPRMSTELVGCRLPSERG